MTTAHVILVVAAVSTGLLMTIPAYFQRVLKGLAGPGLNAVRDLGSELPSSFSSPARPCSS
jgi:hypothetical protein